MHRFFTKGVKKSIVALFLMLFALAVLGGAQYGSPVVEKEHTPGSIVCDIHTPVTDAACSAGNMMLVLLALLTVAWVGVGTIFQITDLRSALWRMYRCAYYVRAQRIFSSIQEAFRRGRIHPKIYHSVASF